MPHVGSRPPENNPVIQLTSPTSTAQEHLSGPPVRTPICLLKNWIQPAVGRYTTYDSDITDRPPLWELSYNEYDLDVDSDDVTGVLNPNTQYNIYWIKYSRLSKKLFLSSSYPKTQPLAPALQERPPETGTTAHPRDRCRFHLSVKRPLLRILLEW